MKKETKEDVKVWAAISMAAAAVGFGVAGFCVDPKGEISDSVLYLIAQCLIFSATLLGVDYFAASAVRRTLAEKGGNNEQ